MSEDKQGWFNFKDSRLQSIREGILMSVSIECKQCGVLGFFNGDKDYKAVSGIVNKHKVNENKKHRVWVRRS